MELVERFGWEVVPSVFQVWFQNFRFQYRFVRALATSWGRSALRIRDSNHERQRREVLTARQHKVGSRLAQGLRKEDALHLLEIFLSFCFLQLEAMSDFSCYLFLRLLLVA
jgi:hypothetical protein